MTTVLLTNVENYDRASCIKKPYGKTDNSILLGCIIGYSAPAFWIGMMAILFFGAKLGWFPVQGMMTPHLNPLTGLAYYVDLLRHLILPAFTLALAGITYYARMTRSTMLEELRLYHNGSI